MSLAGVELQSRHLSSKNDFPKQAAYPEVLKCHLFPVYECFVRMYICELHVCIMPTEVRRGCWSWSYGSCELPCGCWFSAKTNTPVESSLHPQAADFESFRPRWHSVDFCLVSQLTSCVHLARDGIYYVHHREGHRTCREVKWETRETGFELRQGDDRPLCEEEFCSLAFDNTFCESTFGSSVIGGLYVWLWMGTGCLHS